jgi:very-short-patch-repair endonuclease
MRFHSTPRRIERDRRKEAELVRAGYRVVRMTWDQIVRDPGTAALTLNAALKA